MAEELLRRGDRCFVDEDYDAAIDLYTQAIDLNPQYATAYESRANAHLKAENFTEAAEDASKAIALDPGNAKAYLRQGIALFNLEEYESAKESFEAGERLSDLPAFKTWLRKCAAEMEDEQVAGLPASVKAPSETVPASVPPSKPGSAPAPESTSKPQSSDTAPSCPSSSTAAQVPLAPSAPAPQQGKYRYQWYQIQNKVVLDVYAKKLRKEQVDCKFSDTHLEVHIKDDSGASEFDIDVELFGPVDLSRCRCEVLTTKVEVTMVKSDPLHWPTLHKDTQKAVTYSVPAPVDMTQYPTSYKKSPKDWSKIEAELQEQESKGELDAGDPLNNFFKKIFSQGDEDQRRAMMKSFVESNGTVLSTNWQEVGAKKVECTPPDGMEVHKWSG